jgi:type II secretory ATPase GspE/PulE/Tfp pilus assembly ATPase PilB-like protein
MACAQRLVRRICSNCREEFVPEPEMFERLGMAVPEGATFFHGSGCDRCKHRGYLGRVAIIEALPVSEAIRRLIIKRASAAVVKNQAISEGMRTLRMIGIDKAVEGITTLEEIWRVTAEDH